MSHPQTLQIPFLEFMVSASTIVDSSQILQLEYEKSQFSCNSHKKIVPLQPNYKNASRKVHTMPYKVTAINNRRYLGNKYRLLPFIKQVVKNNCRDVKIIADLFAGTGAVSSAFQDLQIITNDLLYSNYISNLAWFSAQPYDEDKIIQFIIGYNAVSVRADNYMSNNFADTFFSKQDCRKIGYIREDIERNFKAGKLNERERALLITSLLYAMDKIAKTCGHYDAYRKGVEFDLHLELSVPQASQSNNPSNICYNQDINTLAPDICADLVYLDPPYNSRQYCDAYHVLENVARWEKPKVFGVAKKMDRTALKSAYCTKEATHAFADLIEKINARYILLSYNNMENKGNERSNAKLADTDIMRILSEKGEVLVFEEDYKAFTTGRSNIQDNAERLFLCICNQ